MDQRDIQTGLELIKKDFLLDANEWPANAQTLTEKEAYEKLLKLVEHLLSKDVNHLLNVLYRVDVPEQKLKKALAESEKPAETIASMIWKRELQKAETRRKYSGV